MTNIYTLRAGDIVEYAGQPCQVIRVTESAAVVAVVQKPRTITPRFRKPVTIQPAPKVATFGIRHQPKARWQLCCRCQ